MSNKTYLDTSDGMGGYAQRHGAKLDRAQGKWYVEGEVPAALMNLVPKPKNKPYQVVAPLCPACGRAMRLQTRKKDGVQFWGCSQYPRCSATVSLEAHLDTLESTRPKSVMEFLKPEASPKAQPNADWPSSSPYHPALQEEIERVLELAKRKLGGERKIHSWLATPKIGLDRQTPLQLMRYIAGCKEVQQLLELFPDYSNDADV